MKMRYFIFTLSMPNNNSWNHRWTGDGDYHAIVKSFPPKHAVITNIEKKKSHYYNFGDGWGANVSIAEVDSKAAQLAKKKTRGFCGYDWMVNEIIELGRIRNRDERIVKNVEGASNA